MSTELLCRICSLPVYKSPTPHTGYYKVKSNGEVKDAQIDLGGERFHKKCAKCSKCKCYLLADNFQKDENLVLFCTEHFVGNTNTAGAAVVSNGDSAKAAADAEVLAEEERKDAEEKVKLEEIAVAEKAKVEAEEKAKLEAIAAAEEKARVDAEEKARLEAIAIAEKDRLEAEEKARIEAIAAAEKTRLETEEKTRVEAATAAAVAASAVLSDKATISPPSKPPRKSGANDATPRSPVLTARSTGGNDTARSADSTVNETTSASSISAGLVATTAATGVIIAATTTDESSKDKEAIAVTHDDNSTTSTTITAEQQAALELAENEKAQAILAADALIASEKEKERVEEAVAAAEKARLEVEAKMKSDAEIAARETADAAAVALAALAAQKDAETKAENTAFETGNATAEDAAHVPIPPSTFVSPRGEETLAILSPPQPPSLTSEKASEKNNTDAMEIGLLAAGATAVAAIAAVAVASSSPRVEPSTTESTTESTDANVTATPEAATATATPSKVGGGILDRVKSFNQSPADKAAAESSIQMSAGRGGSGGAAVLGDNVITKMLNMADEYTANGAYEPAEQMYTKCLGARRTKLGEDHEETLLNRSKLALLYTKWNKPAKAEEMYLKVYEIKNEKYGENDGGALIAMSELADFYANPSSKEYKKAEELYLPCLELNKIKYGEDADETVAVMDSLATLYRLQENKSKATFYLERCVELKTKKYGSQNTGGSGNENVLNSIIRLAENYYESRRYDKCEPLYIQIHSMKKAKLSESDDETMKYLLLLGHTYKEQRKYAEATPVYETYLDLQVKKLGESHKETLGTMSYLLTYFSLPENKIFEKCEAVHLRRLKIYQELYDDDNKETIQARVDIIAFYKSYKKSAEIEKFYLALLAVYQSKYGVADVKKTLPLQEEIAAWYKEEGSSKFTEAEKIFIDIYNTKRSSTSNELGEVHASTLTSLQAIIDLYESNPNGVQLESVEKWTLKGYEIRRERLGENHEDTLKAQLALAMVYKRMKKWSDGEKLLIKYVEVNKTKYGDKSPEATEAVRVLAEFRAQMTLESPAAGCACVIS